MNAKGDKSSEIRQQPSIPPWDLDSHYRPRSYDLKLGDLAGWSESCVIRKLGEPSGKAGSSIS